MDTNDKINLDAYYRERYEVIAFHQFEDGPRTVIQDHCENRVCRFCGRDESNTEYRSEAHAIPEFLGNRKVFCFNECDSCNRRFGHEYEDHLAKWSHLIRSMLKIRGKKKYPKFKSESFRVEPARENLHVEYLDSEAPRPDTTSLPIDMELYGDSRSQQYVPVRAAMALVKVAISVCPASCLGECKRAIEWLNNPEIASIDGLRVGHAFTPGPVPSAASHVKLLRRKTDHPIPFFWLILQCRNFRLQIFVPFCESDDFWMQTGEQLTIPYYAYPSLFDDRWAFGSTEFGTIDWSSNEPQRTESKVSMRFTSLRSTDG